MDDISSVGGTLGWTMHRPPEGTVNAIKYPENTLVLISEFLKVKNRGEPMCKFSQVLGKTNYGLPHVGLP